MLAFQKKLKWVLVGLLVLVSCKHSDSITLSGVDLSQAPRGRTFDPLGEFILGDEDLIDVYVHNHPEYSGRYRVARDGFITMPRIGQVRATGRSAPLLRTAIAIKLRPFVKYPRVSVTIVTFESYKVVFSGSIRKPGLYTLERRTTLLEGLAIAGGVHAGFDQQIVIIREDENGKKRRFLTSYRELMVGSPSLDEFILERGDIIYIN